MLCSDEAARASCSLATRLNLYRVLSNGQRVSGSSGGGGLSEFQYSEVECFYVGKYQVLELVAM